MSQKSDFGLIGLAVMGRNLALNFADHGVRVAAYNRTTSVTDQFVAAHRDTPGGLVGCRTLDELVAEYSTARVAVVPSFFEGFGFPASEAMACGLPVIASAAGALPEVVGSDGSTGRLVPPRDPRALADAILDVLADPARTEQMGRAARARVQRVFQWKDAAAGLVRVFEETLRAAHRRSRAA